MATTPRGMTVTEAYRIFRSDKLVVNRAYQRKLVWTMPEKTKLIDSMLKGYPIPLILLLTRDDGRFEIIDGMQRLNAITSFIETGFALDDGNGFDINEFPTAKDYASRGTFHVNTHHSLLSRERCALFLDYQLAVTIFSVAEASDVTDIFGRINSGGKHLSPHEQRQAGVTSRFAALIRKLSSELRGDASAEVVNLADMPLVSIDAPMSRLGYGVHADATFWCKQGILRTRDLRDSEDEQFLADLAISILQSSPFAASRENFDEIYDKLTTQHQEIENALSAYGETRLSDEIKTVISIFNDIVETVDSAPNVFRRAVNPRAGGNPVKTPFYAVFMALHQIVIREEKRPVDHRDILTSITRLADKLETGTHHVSLEGRQKNIALTIGLIQKYFAHRDPPLLRHGAGLAVDFENSLRRSRIETPRYEFKQGWLKLDSTRNRDPGVVEKIVKTACAIANIGPGTTGFVFLGVADKDSDANRVKELDKIAPLLIEKTWVVGIDREVTLLGTSIEQYVRDLIGAIRAYPLSDSLKTGLLAGIDPIEFRGRTVIRLTVPPQQQPSWVGEQIYIREGSETIEATGRKIQAISSSFRL